ncbi:MAG TPA: shikimate dehydrogenase [Actinomycetota bacterium]|nr:shikimate dehydrogenase [Actinomycetota bacterium]
MLSGTTRVAGLVGGPRQVSRSLSPAIHNAAYAATGLDWVYVGFPVEVTDDEEVAFAIRGLLDAGVAGLNVTMPHKRAAASAMDRLVGPAEPVRAVNTVRLLHGEAVGWNTDGEGLVSFLTREGGVVVAQASVLVIGSGGSARSVIAGMGAAGASAITVLARDPERAGALAPLAGGATFRAVALDGYVTAAVAAADLIVNATPVGQQGEEPLIPTHAIRPDAVVVDLIYHPAETILVREAARQGAVAFGGLGMLVHQAALAFEILTGVAAPVQAMWEGARAARTGST